MPAHIQPCCNRDDVLTLLIHLGYLAYDENEEKVYIPNDEIKSEFVRAVKNGNKKELIKAVQKSDKLLDATWRMDEDTVAQIIEEMHSAITAPTFYYNEQALRSVIKMAFISSIDYYARIDELPTGKGFADMVFWPKKNASCPPLIVELKWNKSSSNAIEQIDEKQYASIFTGYAGTVLKVGINYNVKDKKHSCKIEALKDFLLPSDQ